MKWKAMLTVLVLVAVAAGSVAGTMLTGSSRAQPGADGSVPTAVHYQGTLVSPATGNPLPDGDYGFDFAIYDAPAGGAALWQETQQVAVQDGMFSVMLGNQTPLDAAIFGDTPTYLGVKVGADEEMVPRQLLASVPYAFQAENARTLQGEPAGSFLMITGGNLTGPLRVDGDIQANGTIRSGSSIVIDGVTHTITSDLDLELHTASGRALRIEDGAASPNIIGGHSANSAGAGVSGATIGGGGTAALPNTVTAGYGTVGGGRHNTASAGSTTVGGGAQNSASDGYGTVGGGYHNTASGYAATVGGGYSNTAGGDRAAVGGGTGNTASGYYATVGGGLGNTAGDYYATVAGGDTNTASGVAATVAGGDTNTASGDRATVAGGDGNTAGGARATVGGGYANTAGALLATVGGGGINDASGIYATVAGGVENTASAEDATVGGGRDNTASGIYATVAGGYENTASGFAATVAGGLGNTASGYSSFAAGYYAKAVHDGCFVWGDSTSAVISSTGVNQFIVRASGGFYVKGLPSTSSYSLLRINPSDGKFYIDSSSQRYKDDIQDFDDDFDIILDAQPKTYTDRASGHTEIGYIAEDFDEMGLTNLVVYNAEGEPDGLKYDRVSLYLVEVIKDQQAQIESLLQRVEALEDPNR